MNPISDATVFRKGVHQLSVINTDLVEAESLVKTMAEKEQQSYPQRFAGLAPCVYFKMPYIQPCDSYKELRRLILRIRENTGLRADYKGIVAIEATEWLGHEREEYFTVLLKFLYDHRDLWKAAMVLNDCKPAQIQRFLSACVRYVTPKVFDIKLFEDADVLRSIIQEAFQKRNTRISHAAASMLATSMVNPALKDLRSLTFIERTVDEVLSYNDTRQQITVDRVKEYLLDNSSTITLMAGKILYDERGTNSEKEAVQLRG